MAEYTVFWIIDVTADSPEGAAEFAYESQVDPDSLARCFHVCTEDSAATQACSSIRAVSKLVEVDPR